MTFLVSVLTAILAAVISPAEDSSMVNTYHVVAKRWGAPIGSDISWGRMKDVDFDITIDTGNKLVSVNDPEKMQTYGIVDEHDKAIEMNDARYGGPYFCIEDEYGARNRVYLRMRNGVPYQIMFFLRGTIWCYCLG